MANLAIKGHPTRGRDIIQLLEMLGGRNSNNCTGQYINRIYFINKYGYIESTDDIKLQLYCATYNLEEFEEKFPYKVGNKVNSKYFKNYKIEKMEWIDTDNKIVYKLQGNGWYNVDELEPYKEKTIEERKYSDLRLPLDDDDDKLATEVTIGGNKILPPNGYLIGKITQVDNGMIVEYVKKQPQYPKTYKDCCNTLYINSNHDEYYEVCLQGYPMQTFARLLICRDTYWKIAGEQMGLSKPWESDFTNNDEERYGIYTLANKVEKDFCGVGDVNMILVFPTEEMRDAFYENFKELINDCKELL